MNAQENFRLEEYCTFSTLSSSRVRRLHELNLRVHSVACHAHPVNVVTTEICTCVKNVHSGLFSSVGVDASLEQRDIDV